MARKLSAVWILQAELVVTSPLAVGGLGQAGELVIARDGAGRPYVPGSSLAGCLRSLTARALDTKGLRGQLRDGQDKAQAQTVTDQLFGYSTRQGDGGLASPLRVMDAPIDGARLGRRDGVAIDRWAGAAADNLLFSREVIEPGATLPLWVEVEVPDTEIKGSTSEGLAAQSSTIDALMPALAAVLKEQGLTVGAAGSRGLGRLRVDNLRLLRLDLSQRAQLALWWKTRANPTLPEPLPPELLRAPEGVALGEEQRFTFRVHWHPLGPILVKSGQEGPDIRQMPLTVRCVDGQYRAALPGSSIRGALRSHAERIIRSIRPFEEPISDKFLEQIQVEVVSELFGRARSRSEGPAKERALARGALTVLDCLHRQALATPPLGLTDEHGRSEDAPEGWQVRSRIAVDRFTGGALDSALFKVMEPAWEPRGAALWEPITLTVDLHRLASGTDTKLPALAMGLLSLLLRDLAEGELPLGFGTRQGMGRVVVTRVEAVGAGLAVNDILAEDEGWSAKLNEWEEEWQTFARV